MVSVLSHSQKVNRPSMMETVKRSSQMGSAVVDFVLVGSLLALLFMAIIQLTLVLHVRNILTDAASSGARYGALADRGPRDAQERTVQLINSALNSDFSTDVRAQTAILGGGATIEVTVWAPLPVIGLVGPRAIFEISGRAAVQAR